MPPSSSEALLAGARRALMARRYRDAHAACMQVLREDPRSSEAFDVLARIALDNNTFDKASELFRRADALSPSASHRAGLARALLGLNRAAEARGAALGALAHETHDAEVLDTLCVVLSRTGQHAEALRCIETAVGLDPDNPGYQVNLGWERQFLGDLAGAAGAYRRAIALAPDQERAYVALVRLAEQTAENNVIAPLERLFAQTSDPEARLRIGHALAKSFEDLENPLAALEWLVAAKAGMAERTTFDIDLERQAFDAAAASAVGPSASTTSGGEAAIFVLGLPRTGTTLVDRILSSHPQVVSVGEPTTFPLLVRRMSGVNSRRLYDAAVLDRARMMDMDRLGRDYLGQTSPPSASDRFIDKTPLNFLYAGLIARALPQARIICLRRHPMDACLSIFRQPFATDVDYYNYAYRLEDTARYYVLFDRLVAQWRERLPADRFLEVEYEALVADQENQSRRVVDFCGLAWDDRCLAFQENAAPVATASAAQVRQPIYETSVGRWRAYGDALSPMLRILAEAGLVDEPS
jgi:tetratricopeptide (TPR) repeat protein